jgi:predicted NAD/FAD-dependent oxidoreductase
VDAVRNELKTYFDTDKWSLIKSYRIKHALPKQHSVLGDIMPARFILNEGVYICGDYLLNGSQNAALRMGRKVAQRIMKDERSGLKKNRKKKKYSKFFEKE